MKKHSTKKVSFKEASNRFYKQGRIDIELCENGWNGWKKKSKFYDFIEKDFFWSLPAHIYKRKSGHPNRAGEFKKKTMLERYGVENPMHLIETKEKSKQTNFQKYGTDSYTKTEEYKKRVKQTSLEKYGVEHFTQNKDVIKKQQETNLKRYGVNNPNKSKEIRKKHEKTMLERHGVKNPSQVDRFQLKKKVTNFKKYGVEYYSQSNDWKEKSKQTCLERYGVEHPMRTTQIKNKVKNSMKVKYGVEHISQAHINKKEKKIIETGQSVRDWLKNQDEPKPTPSSLNLQLGKTIKINLKILENIIHTYRNYKSDLETFAEKLFDCKHYNKKPKKITKLYRPDFKLSETTFINVDGLYWHSEYEKNKNYHFNLRKEFEVNDLRIFQFREDEIYNKTDIVKSIINNSLQKTGNKIFARKCKIQIVKQKETTQFLNNNHLMGSTNAKHLGLFFNNQLVAILSFKQRKNVCKIERFCSVIDTNVVGGFSKLLNHLEKNYLKPEISEIHYWVDLRYGTGNHLKEKGFNISHDTMGWKWTDGTNTFNRLKCKANMDHHKLSEKEHADELGWYKIYDAGQRLWKKNI